MAEAAMDMPAARVVKPDVSSRPQISTGGKQESPISTMLPKSNDRGVIDAINTGKPEEINAAVEYAAGKDTREAAFAAREKHIAYQKAMGEPLNDQALAGSFLEKKIDDASRAFGGKGTDLEKDYARKRIMSDYRARAMESPSVVAAKGTASEEAYEAEIQGEINNLVIRDAKADLARRIGEEKTATEGLTDLASGATGEPGAVEPEKLAEPFMVPGPHGEPVPIIAGGAPLPGEAPITEATEPFDTKPAAPKIGLPKRNKAGQIIDSSTGQYITREGAFKRLEIDQTTTSEPAQPAPTPEPSAMPVAEAPADPASVSAPEPGSPPSETAEPVPEPNASPKPDIDLPVGERLASAKTVRDAAQAALDGYSGNDLGEYRSLEKAFREADGNYRDLQSESDRTLFEQRISTLNERLDQVLKSNEELRAELKQAMETQGKKLEDAVKKVMEYVDEKDPEKKKDLKRIILELAAAIALGIGISATSEMTSTIQQQSGQG